MATQNRAQRKTNEELNAAIFAAAMAILNESGYEHVTFNTVASRAGTSRAVLYRHWNSVFDLLLDAQAYFDESGPETFANIDFSQGSLRTNLINSLMHFDGSQPFLRALLIELGQNNPAVHQYFNQLHQQQLFIMERMLSAAQLTGEIQHTVTDNVKQLPFDLLLYQAMVDQEPVTQNFIETLIDTVVLPAIMAQQQ